ncbi:hypothetical protein [Streptomyces avicenniae]|uniref:hypothetical protein n=1 Tax=Streptomyces avicenniae TaxID=500153 RepID=UPI003B83849C
MSDGGFIQLPDGSVVVALVLPHPREQGHGEQGHAVRVLVHAANRPRALTRLRNLGLRVLSLRGNGAPPTPDEISAVLYHPDGAVWRPASCDAAAGWCPMARLVGPARRRRRSYPHRHGRALPVAAPQGQAQGVTGPGPAAVRSSPGATRGGGPGRGVSR